MEKWTLVYRPRFNCSHILTPGKGQEAPTLCGLTANGHGLFLGFTPEEQTRAQRLRLCRTCVKLAEKLACDGT